MDKLKLAVKISQMVEDGWTFKPAGKGGRIIAEHSVGGGYTFFDSEEELVKWLTN